MFMRNLPRNVRLSGARDTPRRRMAPRVVVVVARGEVKYVVEEVECMSV